TGIPVILPTDARLPARACSAAPFDRFAQERQAPAHPRTDQDLSAYRGPMPATIDPKHSAGDTPMSANAVASDPIPLRALNQVTYCPRLYYLQYVDCVMPTNEHVEAGLHDHRRVDDPALANRTRADGDAQKTRGVALSSAALGLTGVLDQIEEKAGEQVPVETKHGSAPRDDAGRPTAWDND